MTDSVEQQLCDIIDEMSGGRDLPFVGRDSKLFEEGYIDSFGFFDLLARIEKVFSMTFEDRDLTKEHFATVESLERLMCTKLASSRT